MPEHFSETMRAASEAGWSHAFCSHIERPSIDPELMMQMLLVGYRYDRRSERRRCERRTSIWHTAGFVDWVSRTRPGSLDVSKNRYGRVRESALFRRSASRATSLLTPKRNGALARPHYLTRP
jgi:hypothetical protein